MFPPGLSLQLSALSVLGWESRDPGFRLLWAGWVARASHINALTWENGVSVCGKVEQLMSEALHPGGTREKRLGFGFSWADPSTSFFVPRRGGGGQHPLSQRDRLGPQG